MERGRKMEKRSGSFAAPVGVDFNVLSDLNTYVLRIYGVWQLHIKGKGEMEREYIMKQRGHRVFAIRLCDPTRMRSIYSGFLKKRKKKWLEHFFGN